MNPSYSDVFGGSSLRTSETTFLRLEMSTNVQLSWPLEQEEDTNPVSDIIEVDADSGGLNVDLPDARNSARGPIALFHNTGSETVSIRDVTGGAVASVESGEAWYVYLADNSTEAGTWETTQFGAGTSSANAADLAGAGLKAVSTTLNTKIAPQTVSSSPVNLSDSDRAEIIIWEGGVGTLNLPDPGTVGSDWYVLVRNAGSGDLTVTPPSGNIDGQSNKVFSSGDSAIVTTDGTNFYTVGFGQSVSNVVDFISINVGGTGNYTLSSNEQDRVLYRLTGTLTGSRNIIVPDRIQQYWVDNQTSGSFTLTVKTSGGTGVESSQGSSRIVYSDGVNVQSAERGKLPQPVTEGGTGLEAVAQGDILYASATNTIAKLSKNTNDIRYLANQGTDNNPVWEQVSLTQGVTGRLPFSSIVQGSALSVLGVAGDSSADLASIAAASDHQVLRRSGSSVGFGAVNLAEANATMNALLGTRGGTDQSTVEIGDLLYGDSSVTSTWARLARVTSPPDLFLMNTGTSQRPKWESGRFAGGTVIDSDQNLALAHAWSILVHEDAADHTFTIQNSSVIAFPEGACIVLFNRGPGNLTISPDGTALYGQGLRATYDQDLLIRPGYGGFLFQSAENNWILVTDSPSSESTNEVGFVGSDGSTGNDLPDGWSAVRNSTGNYTVTHNEGSSGFPVANADAQDAVAGITSNGASGFTVQIVDTGAAATDQGFYFSITFR